MKSTVLCIAGSSAALQYAGNHLQSQSITVTQEPCEEMTHLLLPVPTLDAEGKIKGGISPEDLVKRIHENTVIFGGNLKHPVFHRFTCIDLLQDSQYLAENAEITADRAIIRLGAHLPVTISGCPILVIGWGRIGKCLAQKLKALNADITVAARKETDRATLCSLGYQTIDTADLQKSLPNYRVIINTAPFPMITERDRRSCHPECVFLDLASTPGIMGDGILWERGLPSRDAPESSGKLIGQTVLRYLAKGGTI